jgi:hypothetical protein
MRQKLTPLVLGLCLIGAINLPVFAETSGSPQAQSIEQQVTELQKEVGALKKELKHSSSKHHAYKKKSATSSHVESASKPSTALSATDSNPPQISGPSSLPSVGSLNYLPIDLDVPGQSFVSSGPYLGIPLEYSGSNLIINSPSINEDVLLLKMRQNINQRLEALGMKRAENKSHLLLSGFIEGQAGWSRRGINPSTTNIDLSAANLDAYILGPNNWTSGLMEFAFDNDAGANEGSLFHNTRALNSRVFINKAFIILGDFSQSPFYTTIGQMYVPFGVYSSTMISSPFTKTIGRTQARAINFGYQQQSSNALFGAVYLFRGDSHGSATNRVNNGGINVGYRLKTGPFSEVFGAGVIGNIADAQAQQVTGLQSANMFGGFGATGMCPLANGTGTAPCGNERLVHRVPAYDVNAKFSIGSTIDILTEYVVASTNFNTNDLTLNSHGARPQALNAEAIYSFEAFNHPTSFGASYQISGDALAFGLPAKRYSLALNTSIWRNTLESLEFHHDIDYGKVVTSSGSKVVGPQGTGHSGNAIIAQIDLYF